MLLGIFKALSDIPMWSDKYENVFSNWCKFL